MDTRQKLFDELTSFSEKCFEQRDYFVCVYGSYAAGTHTKMSDVDVFIALGDYDATDLDKAKDFLIDLHGRYGLYLDHEVPYENKLVVSYSDVRKAIDLRAFNENDVRYVVPNIKKEPGFLASPEMRWRLILNALTSPHGCVGGNNQTYTMFRVAAEKSMMRLAHGLVGKENPSPQELLEILLCGDCGEEGEMYLGYKKGQDVVVRYLKRIIDDNHATHL